MCAQKGAGFFPLGVVICLGGFMCVDCPVPKGVKGSDKAMVGQRPDAT